MDSLSVMPAVVHQQLPSAKLARSASSALARALDAASAITASQCEYNWQPRRTLLAQAIRHLGSLAGSLDFISRLASHQLEQIEKNRSQPPKGFDSDSFLEQLAKKGLLTSGEISLKVKHDWLSGGEKELYARLLRFEQDASVAAQRFRNATEAVFHYRDVIPAFWSNVDNGGMALEAIYLQILPLLLSMVAYWEVAQLFIEEIRRLKAEEPSLLEDFPEE